MPTDADQFVPLNPLSFEVLLILLDGQSHAYSIVKQIEERTAGQHEILPANLYRRIRDMLEQGLLEEAPLPEEDRRRRNFRITRLGRRAVKQEARRLESAVGRAREKGLLGNA